VATDENDAGLYIQYADGSIFEIYVLRCENFGQVIDPENTFYLHVQAAAPLLVGMHTQCASRIVELR
jgi:hypothetical protein